MARSLELRSTVMFQYQWWKTITTRTFLPLWSNSELKIKWLVTPCLFIPNEKMFWVSNQRFQRQVQSWLGTISRSRNTEPKLAISSNLRPVSTLTMSPNLNISSTTSSKRTINLWSKHVSTKTKNGWQNRGKLEPKKKRRAFLLRSTSTISSCWNQTSEPA